jgi:uncharacterized protein YjbJ (UPF0337 family)
VTKPLAHQGRASSKREDPEASATPFRLGAHLLGIWQAGSPNTKEEFNMGEVRDKTRNAAQSAKGKAKEAAGKSTGNRKLESKGKADQTKAKVKKTGEKVKDVFR